MDYGSSCTSPFLYGYPDVSSEPDEIISGYKSQWWLYMPEYIESKTFVQDWNRIETKYKMGLK